jgi:hypothetical protein
MTLKRWLPHASPTDHAIAVRGLVEQALLLLEKGVEIGENTRSALRSAAESCGAALGKKETALLQWELSALTDSADHMESLDTSLACQRGYVAVIGWSLWRFAALRKHVGEVARAFGDVWAKTLRAENVKTVAGAYSSILQWLLWSEADEDKRGQLVKDAACGVDVLQGLAEEHPELALIYFDECLWAGFNEDKKRYEPELTAALNRIGRARLAGLNDWVRGKKGEGEIYFSLCWHDGWTADEAGRQLYYPKVEAAVGERVCAGMESVAEDLQYHWDHFVIQTAVWMREWCLGDPFEGELQVFGVERGTSGTGGELQESLGRLLTEIVSRGTSDMVRCATLLAVWRMVSIGQWRGGWMEDVLLAVVGRIDRAVRNGDKVVVRAFLLAVFELIREDQVFSLEVAEPNEAQRQIERILESTLPTCREFASGAWIEYQQHVADLTCLDVVPRRMASFSARAAALLA